MDDKRESITIHVSLEEEGGKQKVMLGGEVCSSGGH